MPTKRKTTKRKGSSNAGTAKLRKITAAAKAIRKANPSKKWNTCQREAAAKLR